jgi:hypothetical protein
MNKLKWPWQRRRVERRVEIVRLEREPSRLTVAEWRSDRAWVASAAAVLRQPQLRQMLDAVGNSSPAFEVLPLDAGVNARLVQQARAEGYTMALANFEALGTEVARQEPVQARFEPPVQEQPGGGGGL